MVAEKHLTLVLIKCGPLLAGQVLIDKSAVCLSCVQRCLSQNILDMSTDVDHHRCWVCSVMDVMTSGGYGVGAQQWFSGEGVLVVCGFAGSANTATSCCKSGGAMLARIGSWGVGLGHISCRLRTEHC